MRPNECTAVNVGQFTDDNGSHLLVTIGARPRSSNVLDIVSSKLNKIRRWWDKIAPKIAPRPRVALAGFFVLTGVLVGHVARADSTNIWAPLSVGASGSDHIWVTGYVTPPDWTTADGHLVGSGIAACPLWFPFGTVIDIEGVGQVTCHDHTPQNPWLIDVWFPTYRQAYDVTSYRAYAVEPSNGL